MDQKRLLAAIALSVGILLLFDLWNRPAREAEQRRQAEISAQQAATAPAPGVPAPGVPAPGVPAPGVPVPAAPLATPGAPLATPGAAVAAAEAARAPETRLPIVNPRLQGSLSLRGARLDDLVLRGYRETVAPDSPLVRLLAPRSDANPYFAQWGWTAADGRTPVPGPETDWTAEGGTLSPTQPVTLRWDNGQGQEFRILLELDEDYMLTARQSVRNTAADAVQLLPWARVRRERTPQTAGFFILHEGFTGVLDGRLIEWKYSDAKTEAEKRRGPAMEQESTGGWIGFTDKYWLAALTPADQATQVRAAYRHSAEGGQDRWQLDLATPAAQSVAPGAEAGLATRLFAGAKEVHLLDSYESRLNIEGFDKAIDFGWFYWITKPFFYALDWLFGIFGNFGVAILIFTFALKLAFFPLANKAYISMARMKTLAPKMTEVRERYKDDPAKAQAEMMALYKAEKVNPASGCLPILLQIPIFFSLYKVLFVTIEMRHAPFFGWIQDLSAPDPTNLFNLFGILPYDPMQLSSFLHMPAWAIAMGITMFLQFKLNPTPPDPIQAKVFAWMPLIFTFMLASFPAGLVIYWTWNNLLSIAQQYWIMQMDKKRQASRPAAAPTPPKPLLAGKAEAKPAPKGRKG
ncbi:membrane protein insertase YidC [Falsiroseomonas selenitidurans]|uniref:Membrane protein insertase YidC n=1 Tax=Falsiroseomonas selenitidurans TaxID=2716335 RepID=A0ABX1DXU2_9PROT|nr:membrane protein insertase YidC [Falsiroseomonas selenitidurans]NKC29691.1 membrane protein insertase YidC [Falsiroseomonas selenitidurans]